MLTSADKIFLQQAIDFAKVSMEQGGFPAGSVLVKDAVILGSSLSCGLSSYDEMSHSDLVTLLSLRNEDLAGTILYASVEPCLMCYMAASWRRVAKIVYALPKDRLSEAYYNTTLPLREANRCSLRPIELVVAPEFADQMMELVKAWESSLS
jgi:tRNA(Arg) A34 adenosine deaminase TadA